MKIATRVIFLCRKNSGNILEWRLTLGEVKMFCVILALAARADMLSLDLAVFWPRFQFFHGPGTAVLSWSLPFSLPVVRAYPKSHCCFPLYPCPGDVEVSLLHWFSNPSCLLEAPVSFSKLFISWSLLQRFWFNWPGWGSGFGNFGRLLRYC